ncbi:hypothetical protein V8E55_000970 [Tylopilus felleus]
MTRLPVVWARPKPNSPSQRVGVIDAVLSEDVDNFLFGATMVIQNPLSGTLSANRAHPAKDSQGKDD